MSNIKLTKKEIEGYVEETYKELLKEGFFDNIKNVAKDVYGGAKQVGKKLKQSYDNSQSREDIKKVTEILNKLVNDKILKPQLGKSWITQLNTIAKQHFGNVFSEGLEHDECDNCINTESDGKKLFTVKIAKPYSYNTSLDLSLYADNDEDVIEKVAAHLSNNSKYRSYYFDERQYQEELERIGIDEEEDYNTGESKLYYVDSTMEGGDCIYLYLDGVVIIEE